MPNRGQRVGKRVLTGVSRCCVADRFCGIRVGLSGAVWGRGGRLGEIGASDQRSTSPREERYEVASGLSDRLLFVRKCRLPLSGS